MKQGERFVNIPIDNSKCSKVIRNSINQSYEREKKNHHLNNFTSSFFSSRLAPNTPASNSLTPTIPELSNSVVKSTNFTGSVPTSRAEIRHKSEIEIEVKHEKARQNKSTNSNHDSNTSPSSTSSYPPVVRPTPTPNKRTPTILFDEQPPSSQHYQSTKRRILTHSVQTQTPPSHDHHAQQQLKALTDESLSKNEKIQAILRELNDCQVSLSKVPFFFFHHFVVCFFFCLDFKHTHTRRPQALIFVSHFIFLFFLMYVFVLCRQSSNSRNNN